MTTNSFIANVNTLAGMENILAELSANIQTFKKLESNELGINKVVELETGIITIRDNISKLILVANANNELLGIANKLDDLLQVNTNTNDFFFEYEEAKVLVGKFRVEIDKIFTISPEIKDIYEDMKLKSIQINQNLLFNQGINLEVASSAAVSLAAKNAIDENYAVYAEVLGFKVELLAVASKINQLSIIETNLDEKYTAYLQVLGIKPQILEIAPRIEELITSSNEISSNMELALNLLFSARENIELLNDYKTYDETNKLRFEAIETKEITNYTKILTRLKIIEDST